MIVGEIEFVCFIGDLNPLVLKVNDRNCLWKTGLFHMC